MNRYNFLLAILILFNGRAFALEMPLKSQVRLILPPSIKTVASASNYFISTHGYKFTVFGSAPPESMDISQQPIPLSFPYGEIMTIEEALLTLIKKDQFLIIDTKNKLISFGYLKNEGSTHE